MTTTLKKLRGGAMMTGRKTKPQRLPQVEALVYVPRSSVDLDNVCKKLTIEVWQQDAGFDDSDDNEETEGATLQQIELFDLSRKGLIGLPRHYFFSEIGAAHFIDRTNAPKYDPSAFPMEAQPRNPQQAEFVSALADILRSEKPTQAQGNMATGGGKTFSFIRAMCDAGVYPVLIGVHTNGLKNQWLGNVARKEGMRYFLGERWVEENVGVIQQERCEWRDKKVMIGMMPSLVRRQYSREFYRYPAVVCIDEVHKLAAPMLSSFLTRIPSRITFGMTATERKGTRGKVVSYHIGKPEILAKVKVLEPKVYICTVRREQSLWGTDMRQWIGPLSKLEWRQDLLHRLIMQRGVQRGRQVLCLSDRVEQLQDIQERLISSSVAPERIGLFVGEYETGNWKVIAKATNSSGRNIRAHGLGTFPTAYKAKRALLEWTSAKRSEGFSVTSSRVERERVKQTEEEYERIKNDPNVSNVLATYGIFDTGLNIPRLDMGVELTPRSDVEQAVGRILRELPGKPIPEWYSMLDLLYVIETLMGKERQSFYEEFKKLEKRRQKSYRNQRAKIVRIKNVEEILNHYEAL